MMWYYGYNSFGVCCGKAHGNCESVTATAAASA